MKCFFSRALILVILLLPICFVSEAQQCSPSGRIRGKNSPLLDNVTKRMTLIAVKPEKCIQHTCSPPMSSNTQGPKPISLSTVSRQAATGEAHQNVTASTTMTTLQLWQYPPDGTINGGSRCLNNVKINGNGRTVVAMVVDECDSTKGCDVDHDYQPPCPNNIVDASVWKALGVSEDNWGGFDITWSDA